MLREQLAYTGPQESTRYGPYPRRSEPAPVDFDLDEAMGGLNGVLAEASRKNGVGYRCRMSPEVPRRLRGDWGSLRLNSVFEALSPEDVHRPRSCEEAGLGLSMAGRLADLMGGHIFAQSREGEGTAFHLTVALELR